MASDVFMTIDGIPGESQDDKHKDWIELASFSSSVTQSAGSASRSTGGAASGGRADFSDVMVTKVLDKASPKIIIACATGKHIKEITIEFCRATGEKSKYMQYTLKDVIVTSTQISGQGGSGEIPTEGVSFNAGEIEWTYTEFNHKDGKKKGDVKSKWSVVENKGG